MVKTLFCTLLFILTNNLSSYGRCPVSYIFDNTSEKSDSAICMLLKARTRTSERVIRPKSRRQILLEQSHKKTTEIKPYVRPLLTDKWHQYYEPYNLLTPIVEDSIHCVSGCVASALAQVLHFYRYPEHGYGSYTYIDSLGCGQTLTANFEEHLYDWDNMLDNYEGVKYTEAQAYSVAQLMSDCGIATNMRYGKDASGTASAWQAVALTSFFGYDKSVQIHYRDFYSIDEWTTMLKEELSAGRPVLFSGHNYRLGHAFVCDGYDENDNFHFSFGNPNGEGDGYFYLPYLTPDIPPSQDPDSPESGFNLLQMFATNVMPSTSENATGIESHIFCFSNISLLTEHSDDNNHQASIKVKTEKLGNIGWNKFDDIVGLGLKKDGEVIALAYVYPHDFLLEEFDDTLYTDTITLPTNILVNDGTYKLVPVFRDNGIWVEARSSISCPNYLLVNVEGGSISEVKEFESAELSLQKVDFPDWIPASGYPKYSIEVKNGEREFCGRIYIALESAEDSTLLCLLQEQGLTLSPNESTTRTFSHTYRNIPEGVYNLKILYDNDLLSSDLYDLTEENIKTVIVSQKQPVGIDDIAFETTENASTNGQNKSATSTIAFSIDGRTINSNNTKSIYIKNGQKVLAK